MTSADRLVGSIREFVNGFEQEATPVAHEMAQQFCDLCHSLNERLAKCQEFLRRGMRSEAVQEACKAALGEAIHALNRPERPARAQAAAPARA